jgi:hypothetical protein
MDKLAQTTGSNRSDFALADRGLGVVLRCGKGEIVLLQRQEGRYVLVCCPSVNAAEGDEIPDADFYWNGIGYCQHLGMAVYLS